MTDYHGYLNILKAPGYTSHDVVAILRRMLRTKAIGHAGTLDPAASGVLPIAIGKATRLLEYLVSGRKAYIGEVTFGILTDTLDQEGQVLERAADATHFTNEQIDLAMRELTGIIQQVPPQYSAIKHKGKPLYSYARQGQQVEVPPRTVEIFSFQPLQISHSSLLFRVECSKGTYIRTLVADLAAKLGTIGTLTFLLREQVGSFNVQDSVTLEELQTAVEEGRLAKVLQPAEAAVAHLPSVHLSKGHALRFLHGQRLRTDSPLSGEIAVFGANYLLGIAKCQNQVLAPHKVLGKWEDLTE